METIDNTTIACIRHPVDEDVVRRRFDGGWRNFRQIYRNLVCAWALYDSSARIPRLVSEERHREQDEKYNTGSYKRGE